MITADMMTEPTGFAERLAERKESARRTLRDASSEELQALVAQLFPDGTHPFPALCWSRWPIAARLFIQQPLFLPLLSHETKS